MPKANDFIAAVTGASLMAGTLMLAFYAGLQSGTGDSRPLLLGAGLLLPVGAACLWSGVNAAVQAVLRR